jgi:hypothetical protein
LLNLVNQKKNFKLYLDGFKWGLFSQRHGWPHETKYINAIVIISITSTIDIWKKFKKYYVDILDLVFW